MESILSEFNFFSYSKKLYNKKRKKEIGLTFYSSTFFTNLLFFTKSRKEILFSIFLVKGIIINSSKRVQKLFSFLLLLFWNFTIFLNFFCKFQRKNAEKNNFSISNFIYFTGFPLVLLGWCGNIGKLGKSKIIFCNSLNVLVGNLKKKRE